MDQGGPEQPTGAAACRSAGLEPVPRPHGLRHSFASLLLAEGCTVHYVAGQLGHSPTLTLETRGHVLAGFEGADRIDAEREIKLVRAKTRSRVVPTLGADPVSPGSSPRKPRNRLFPTFPARTGRPAVRDAERCL